MRPSSPKTARRGAVVAPAPWFLYVSMALVALAIAIAAASRPVQAQVFNPEAFTLSNGMQVVVVTNRTAPLVSHMVWYRVGAADEPPGLSGIAHYLEHLMFLGTENRAPREFSQIIRRNGGEENAFTSWDYTAYFQNVAVDRLPLMMELEADRMANLRVDPASALNERDVIIEERRERVDNRPGARLSEQMMAALYQNHPYRIPIIGWEHEMAALTLDDAMAFYETWYAPNNAILAISGDIDAETVRELAEATYGRIPPRDVPARIRPQEPATSAERRVVVQDASVRQPSWRRFYLAPSYASAEGNEAYAVQILNEVFGAGVTSRLYQALVVDQELAVGAGSAYSASDLDRSIFGVFVTPRPGADLTAIETAVDVEIARLLSDGVTEAEIAPARERLVIHAAYARDSLTTPARTLGRGLTIGMSVEDIEAWPQRIAAVTVDDVMAAAHQVLRRDRSVTGLLLRDEQSAALQPTGTEEPTQ